MLKTEIIQEPIIVDCHNAMGEEISKEDGEDMLKAKILFRHSNHKR